MPTMHPALSAAVEAATTAYAEARRDHDRDALIEGVADGADGTATSRIDQIVEDAIVAAVSELPVNLVSEEAGWVDNGHGETLVIDPVDGTGNAAAGLPFCAFTGAIAADGEFVEALTHSLTDDRRWWARRDVASAMRTSGQRDLERSIVSLIRPKADPRGFLAVSGRADRARILGSSAIESAFVASGALDAHVDAGGETHRIVDLAAAVVLVEAADGVVVDPTGSPIRFTTDVETRFGGIVAATHDLATEIVETLRSAQTD